MTTILDGKATAKEVRLRVKEGVAGLTERSGIGPGLAVVIVGECDACCAHRREAPSEARPYRDER